MKVAKMAMARIIGSVGDERTFSAINFLKTKLKNTWALTLCLFVECIPSSFGH